MVDDSRWHTRLTIVWMLRDKHSIHSVILVNVLTVRDSIAVSQWIQRRDIIILSPALYCFWNIWLWIYNGAVFLTRSLGCYGYWADFRLLLPMVGVVISDKGWRLNLGGRKSWSWLPFLTCVLKFESLYFPPNFIVLVLVRCYTVRNASQSSHTFNEKIIIASAQGTCQQQNMWSWWQGGHFGLILPFNQHMVDTIDLADCLTNLFQLSKRFLCHLIFHFDRMDMLSFDNYAHNMISVNTVLIL